MKETHTGARSQALKREEKAMNQTWAASRSWEGQGMSSPLEHPERSTALLIS